MFDNTTSDFSTGLSANGVEDGANNSGAIAPSNPLLDQVQSGEVAQSLPIISTIEPEAIAASAANAVTADLEADVRSGESVAAGIEAEADSTGLDPLLLGGLTASDTAFDDVAGTFTVGESGQVAVDFLFDGGGYAGQLAIFSLAGMDGLSQSEFVQEAARRASSNSASGQIVISDATEGAQFSGELGESDVNSGPVAGTQTLFLEAGSQFAVMLVPDGTVSDVASGAQVPFFSIADFNPGGQTQVGQAAEGVFAFEDLVADSSDRDFNDFIFRITGATADITDLEDLIDPNRNWLNNPVAQPFLEEPSFSGGDPTPPVEETPPTPPAEEPVNPPAEPTPPPAEQPPAEEPPVEEPPVEEPPAEEPPAEEPPAEEPPVEEPPVEEPPAEEPPAEEPPAEEPPAEEPPAEEPPAEEPPAEEPPVEEPPAEEPPVEEPPAEEPPVVPPVEEPPAEEPPAEESPVEEPPVEEPPAEEPPVEEPPVEEPPAEEPPAEEPPVEEPPAEEPPAEEPPVEEPPAEEPPAEEPPAEEPPVAPTPPPSSPEVSAISTNVAKFNGNSTEAEIIASGAQKIVLGTQTIYIGTEQVTSINQNPILRSFDPVNPSNNWTRRDIETSGTDSRGLGLLWTGEALYGVFTVDGTQNDGQDFRRVAGGAEQQWLRSYGSGGGTKIAVLGQLDPNTGDLLKAAHLSAVLSNGRTNSLVVTGASTNSAGNIVVQSESFFAPRQPDGSAKTKNPGNNEDSPFDYTIEITSDLSRVVSTFAPGWT